MAFKIIISIVIIALIIINIRYRTQVKNIYMQVDFIKKHETNKIITVSGNTREINRFIDNLNELILLHRKITKEYKIKDDRLKETITNISHDIRTPLTSLNGYFQLLIESDSEEEKARYMSIIETRINTLKNLLEDMFTYMKIQDDNYKLDKEQCNINKIVYDNLFTYYEDFESRGIEPNVKIPEKPILIKGNSIALDRIVNNLISNSLIYGKGYIGVNLSKNEDYISLIFENDAEDIEDIDIENIFTRFYKKDEARSINSTGLGLTIVKELVQSMDGKIKASVNGDIFRIEISIQI